MISTNYQRTIIITATILIPYLFLHYYFQNLNASRPFLQQSDGISAAFSNPKYTPLFTNEIEIRQRLFPTLASSTPIIFAQNSLLHESCLMIINVLIYFLLVNLYQHQSDCSEEERKKEALMKESAIPNLFQNILNVKFNPKTIGLFYLYNPIVLYNSFVLKSFQNLVFLILLLSVWCAKQRNGFFLLSPLCISFLAYLEQRSQYSVLLIPLGLMGSKAKLKHLIIFLFVSTACLVFAPLNSNYNSKQEMAQPSLSLLWYFNVQVFHRFESYFKYFFSGAPFLFVLPMTIRLHQFNLELFVLLHYLQSIFQSCYTCYDMIILLLLLLCCPHSMKRMNQYSILLVLALPVPLLLFVVDYYTWLELNTGNANYLFFQALAFQVLLSCIMFDFTKAVVQRDKALRLIVQSRDKSSTET